MAPAIFPISYALQPPQTPLRDHLFSLFLNLNRNLSNITLTCITKCIICNCNFGAEVIKGYMVSTWPSLTLSY